MTLATLSLILVCALLNAAAQLLLKAGTNAMPVGWRLAFEPHILAGVALYATSLVLWIVALSAVDVTVAYPMVSLGYVANAVAARYLLGESLTPRKLAGTGVIAVGVLILSQS